MTRIRNTTTIYKWLARRLLIYIFIFVTSAVFAQGHVKMNRSRSANNTTVPTPDSKSTIVTKPSIIPVSKQILVRRTFAQPDLTAQTNIEWSQPYQKALKSKSRTPTPSPNTAKKRPPKPSQQTYKTSKSVPKNSKFVRIIAYTQPQQ